MSEVPLCPRPGSYFVSFRAIQLNSTARPEQWLQRHPEAGSSWPSWPEASQAASWFHLASHTHSLTHIFSLSLSDTRVDI